MSTQALVSLLVSLLLGGVAFLIVERLLPGVRIRGGLGSAILVALVYGLVKALLFWVLVVLSFPLVVVTLGLFVLVINAFLLWITDKLLTRFEVDGAGTLILAAVLLSVLDMLFRVFIHRGAFY